MTPTETPKPAKAEKPTPSAKAAKAPKTAPTPPAVDAAQPAAEAPKAAKPAKAAKAAKTDKQPKPAEAVPAPAAAKPAPKDKLVRDSFTMPAADFALIAQLKARALGFARPTKKSELLRAGLQALAALSPEALQAQLSGLAEIKTGRPRKAD